MAYTQEDLDQIEAAMVRLGKGEQVVSVRMSTGRVTQYQPADLGTMRSLVRMIRRQINSATGNPRPRRTINVVTSKGL